MYRTNKIVILGEVGWQYDQITAASWSGNTCQPTIMQSTYHPYKNFDGYILQFEKRRGQAFVLNCDSNNEICVSFLIFSHWPMQRNEMIKQILMYLNSLRNVSLTEYFMDWWVGSAISNGEWSLYIDSLISSSPLVFSWIDLVLMQPMKKAFKQYNPMKIRKVLVLFGMFWQY